MNNGLIGYPQSSPGPTLPWRRRWRVGYRYTQPNWGVITTMTLSESTLLVVPMYCPTVRVDRIGLDVTSAGSAGALIRLGIWDDAGSFPGNLLADAGTLDASSGTNLREISISLSLTEGLYWLGAVAQGGATTRPSVRRPENKSYHPDVAQGHGAPSNGGNFAFGKNCYTWSSITAGLPAYLNPAASDMASDTPLISLRVDS